MANEKNKLEEVIHLYLGCEVQVRGDIEKLIGVESDGAVITFSGRYGRRIWGAKEVKLLLRQLSDITEEEAIDLVKLSEWKQYGNHPHERKYETYRNTHGQLVVSWGETHREKNVPVTKESFYPDEFQYLLSKGFDLFSLIETGQAIDKNTLQETKN